MEAAVIRVSSKGQFVIPAYWRKKLGIKEGDELLAVGDEEYLMIKKIENSSLKQEFDNTVGPLRKKIKKLGLTKDDLIEAIDEVRSEE